MGLDFYFTGSRWLGHGRSGVNFLGNCELFSPVADWLSYIPTRNSHTLHSHQYLVFLAFIILAILMGEQWDHFVALLEFHQMTSDVEHFFTGLSSIHLLSCIVSLILVLNYTVFLLLSCKHSLCILDVSPWLDKWFWNILSQPAACFFILFVFSL